MVAAGSPYFGYSAEYASKHLLLEAWRDECEQSGIDLKGWYMEEAGLLNNHDIKEIENKITNA